MRLLLTAKNYRLSEEDSAVLNKEIIKLERILPNTPSDLPLVHLIVEHYSLTRDGKKAYNHFYKGTLGVRLAGENFYFGFGSRKIIPGLHKAFTKLRSFVKSYKSRHFSSHSDYPHKQTIRKPLSYAV